MDKEEEAREKAMDTIKDWFETYDWDEAFERMLRKYEGIQLGLRLPTWAGWGERSSTASLH